MKLAFILLGIFFFIVSVRTQSRELKLSEKIIITQWKKSSTVLEYMSNNTQLSNLGRLDRFGFHALKKSCLPLVGHIEKIEDESEDYPDQTKYLTQLYTLCGQGMLNITNLYIKSVQK